MFIRDFKGKIVFLDLTKLKSDKDKYIALWEMKYNIHLKEKEVFNNKAPANFILNEPTQLKFLDAPFALQTESIFTLINQNNQSNIPCKKIEEYLINIIRRRGDLCLDSI